MLTKFSEYTNEAKKVIGPRTKTGNIREIKREVESIIEDIFDKVIKPKFEYDKSGMPKSIEFGITEQDYSVDYDEPITNDYTPGVLIKRNYDVELTFNNKKADYVGKEGFKIKFNIKLKDIDKEKIKKEMEKSKKVEEEEEEEVGSKDEEWYGGAEEKNIELNDELFSSDEEDE